MYKGGVYKIVVYGIGTYYGESVDIPKRWWKHRRLLSTGRHHCYKLQRAYKELGPNSLHFIVVEQSELLTKHKHLRITLEKKLINEDKLSLNIVNNTNKNDVTADRVPVIYAGLIIYIQRVTKKPYCTIYLGSKTGDLIGIEYLTGKFRSGLYKVDNKGVITKIGRTNRKQNIP